MTVPWMCSDEQMQASSTVWLSTVCTCSGNLCSRLSVISGGNQIAMWNVVCAPLQIFYINFFTTASFEQLWYWYWYNCVLGEWIPFTRNKVVASWEKSFCSLQVFQCRFLCLHAWASAAGLLLIFQWTVVRFTIARVSLLNVRTRHPEAWGWAFDVYTACASASNWKRQE